MDSTYTVRELDELRRAVKDRWLYGSCHWSGEARMSRQYKTGQMEKAVEEIVRTHMLAGHKATDLEADDAPSVPGGNDSSSAAGASSK